MRAPGFEFFPDFRTMRRFRDLGDILKSATTIRMILVGGSALVENQTNVSNVHGVILPHPDSASLALYESTVEDAPALRNKILTVTRNLQKNGIAVKWYPHMIHHAVIIADQGRKSGWVQWESVLPYAPRDSRPCVIVKTAKFESVTLAMQESFEKMFNASATPPRQE